LLRPADQRPVRPPGAVNGDMKMKKLFAALLAAAVVLPAYAQMKDDKMAKDKMGGMEKKDSVAKKDGMAKKDKMKKQDAMKKKEGM
jgi:hypothetical protein